MDYTIIAAKTHKGLSREFKDVTKRANNIFFEVFTNEGPEIKTQKITELDLNKFVDNKSSVNHKKLTTMDNPYKSVTDQELAFFLKVREQKKLYNEYKGPKPDLTDQERLKLYEINGKIKIERLKKQHPDIYK
jgi:hypothetical protein